MKCLIDPEIECSLEDNEDGAFCWACNPDARAEEKASLDAKSKTEATIC